MNTTEYLLQCLAEEGIEVAKDCSKANRFGLSDVNVLEPAGPDNLHRLITEMNELLAVAQMLVEAEILPRDWQDPMTQHKKRMRVLKFMLYSLDKETLTLNNGPMVKALYAYEQMTKAAANLCQPASTLSSPAPRDASHVPGMRDEPASPGPTTGDVS